MSAASSTIPLRAALYLRVSTARQAEHDVSIPDQKLLPGHTVWKNHLYNVTRKGSRNKISKAFVEALLRDFELHGYEAI